LDLIPPSSQYQPFTYRNTRYRRSCLVKGDFVTSYRSPYSLQFDSGIEEFDQGLEVDFENCWSWVFAPQLGAVVCKLFGVSALE
jgi:hypothetical protein